MARLTLFLFIFALLVGCGGGGGSSSGSSSGQSGTGTETGDNTGGTGDSTGGTGDSTGGTGDSTGGTGDNTGGTGDSTGGTGDSTGGTGDSTGGTGDSTGGTGDNTGGTGDNEEPDAFTEFKLTVVKESFNGLARDIKGLSNGGIVIIGTTGEKGSRDGLLITVDQDGNVLGREEFGGIGDDIPEAVIWVTDEEFWVCGSSNSGESGNYDLFWTKIHTNDTNGGDHELDFFDSLPIDAANACSLTNDGRMLIAGVAAPDQTSNGEMLFVKVDNPGTTQETRSRLLDGESLEGHGVAALEIGDRYVLIGNSLIDGTSGSENWDIRVIDVDTDGTRISNKDRTFGGPEIDMAQGATRISDGELITYGVSNSFSDDIDDFDLYLIRLDSLGNPVWNQEGSDGAIIHAKGFDFVNTLIPADSGFITAGAAQMPEGDFDATLLKISSEGNLEDGWPVYYGQEKEDVAVFVSNSADNGYNLAGFGGAELSSQATLEFTGGDFWLMSTDEFGNVAPSAIPVPEISGNAGDEVTVDLSGFFTDINRTDTLTYSSPNLPTGFSLDNTTGELNGTLGDQPQAFTVTASDGELSTSQILTLSVSEAPN